MLWWWCGPLLNDQLAPTVSTDFMSNSPMTQESKPDKPDKPDKLDKPYEPDDSGEPGQESLLDQRLTELEIKATYTEDLLEQLDKVIVRQQQQIDLLLREVAQLRQPPAETGQGAARSLRDDLPPHF
jgi:SlyX protein